MAGRFTPLHSSIWSDPDFVALSGNAQRVYLLAMSQPNVSFAGVVPYTEKRWAGMAKDTTRGAIAEGICELENARFVLVDPDTEELLIRSFVKHGRIYEQKQLRKALVRAYEGILSTALQVAFYAEQSDDVKALLGSLPEAFTEIGDSLPEGCPGASVVRDLDLQPQPQPRERKEAARSSSVDALAAPGCPPSFFDEADQVIAAFADSHPVDDVDRAVQHLIDDRRRFPFASDLRRALTNLLGDPPAQAKPSPLDEAQRAQMATIAEGLDKVRAVINDPDVEQDPEERKRILAEQRSKRGAA